MRDPLACREGITVAEETFTIGAEASCTDGDCGEVRRVIVNPVAREVTHLVVEPKGRLGLARLVPLDLVDASGAQVRIRCTLAQFAELESAEETQFIPGSQGYAAYGPEQVLVWPYYGLGGAGAVTDAVALQGTSQTVTYDAIPLGEVEVRRGDAVQATDGDIGCVHGLVVDPRTHHVTHVLLAEGHLWGKKEVAIPIRSVTRVDDGIQLNITKEQVEDLPPVGVDHLGE
jgi:sporulation protein YlmC with PRC-barrel domain